MRIDTDTYVWGVAKIVIERRGAVGDNPRTNIRLFDENGEESQVSFCVWGIGDMAARTSPAIAIIEDGEERELVPVFDPLAVNPHQGFNDWDNPPAAVNPSDAVNPSEANT